jgi:hypothetical protein
VGLIFHSRSIRVLLWALVLAAAAQAQPFEQMRRHTVRILVVVLDANNQRISGWGGSGYVIADGNHVVTNWHVCCDRVDPNRGQEASRRIGVFIEPDKPVLAETIWNSMKKDLAVIRLSVPSGRPAVTFAPRSLTSEGQRVFALGFPGAGDALTDEAGRAEVKIADGIISAAVRGNPDRPLLAGTALYQTTITTNPGNSGGPVFDECGRVVATHSSSATQGVGVKFSIQADELLSELGALGLKVDVADAVCSTGPAPAEPRDPTYDYLLIGGQAATALLALAAIGVAVTRRGRDYVKKVTTSYRRGGPPPLPRKQQGKTAFKPVLKGIAGYYSGTVLELEGGSFTLGRDARASNLVFPPDTGNVSRRHCTIHFDAALDRFVLEDSWSTNGTFLDTGEQLTPGQEYELKPGDRFYVGSRDNTFEVTKEDPR